MRFFSVVVGCLGLLLCVGCKKQPAKKVSYFKRDEHEQSASFRLIHHMSYEELLQEKNKLVAGGNHFIAIKYVNQMIKKCDDPDELRNVRLEYADMLFILGRLEEAASEYKLFVQLYPASDQAPYADYRSIESVYRQIMSADRDQQKTHDVVDRAKEYAKKAQWHKLYERYMDKVEEMTHTSLCRLYESEVLRFSFYLNRGNCKAASNRLAFIKEHYLPYLEELKPDILELEYELACEVKTPDRAEEIKTELQKKHPTHVCDATKRYKYASLLSW
jgi:outer membrane assembly lipoprotein YfiO